MQIYLNNKNRKEINIRIEPELKKNVEETLNDLGMNIAVLLSRTWNIKNFTKF